MKMSTKVTTSAVALILVFSTVLAIAVHSRADDFDFDGIEISPLPYTQDLMAGLVDSGDENEEDTLSNCEIVLEEASVLAATDFAFELLRAAYEGDNILLSPYSVYTALAMTANGADGKTKSEIEDVLGMTVEEVNLFISSKQSTYDEYTRGTYDSRKILTSANSIWFRNDLSGLNVNKKFLENVGAYYSADVYSAPFNDSTVQDINGWTSEKTEGSIPSVIDKINDDDVMFIINAVLFNAKWKNQYRDSSIVTDTFYSSDASEIETEFLRRGITPLITLEKGYGFYDSYKSGFKYVAFLPHEGVSIEEFIASLDADTYADALKNTVANGANVTLPSYKSEFSAGLKEPLQALGITRAFDPEKSDLTKMLAADEGSNFYLGNVLHKTYIDLNNTGTIASAVTVADIRRGGFTVPETTLKFNRPFVYMIVDEDNIPIFIGTLLNYSEENKTVNVRKNDG